MQKIDSRIISLIRFPMIVGIVMIHSRLPYDVGGTAGFPVYSYLVERGFIGTLTRLCVPMFFMISGYLFFVKADGFGMAAYRAKLKSRARSILSPYLLYCTLAVCLFAVMALVRPDMQSGSTPPLQVWDVLTVTSMYWDMGDNLPIVPQFWFLRNLMVVVVLTPVVYWLVKKVRWLFVVALALLWTANVWQFGIPGTMCLFWFSAGAYLGINKMGVYSVARKLRPIGWLYPLLAVADVATKEAGWNVYLHNVGIMSGVVLAWYAVGRLVERWPEVSVSPLLLASTFFVFAMHEPYSGKVKAVFTDVLPGLSANHAVADVQMVAYYFLWVAVWVATLVSLFAIIRKVSPRIAAVLSGGR